MLDGASAVGLAASIVQIIVFTKGVLSASHELYTSIDGALVQNTELETVTQCFRHFIADSNSKGYGRKAIGHVVDISEQQLRALTQSASQILEELLSTLDDLKVTGKNRRWSSFRQALRSVWTENKIVQLEHRLDRVREQIDTALLYSLRYSSPLCTIWLGIYHL